MDGKFSYEDANSLYPSAIKQICDEFGGFPTGPCTVIPEDTGGASQKTFSFLEDNHACEYTLEITEITKRQHSIPFICHRGKARVDYVNELPPGGIHITVDRITLNDWVKYHGIVYTVKRGVFGIKGEIPNLESNVKDFIQRGGAIKLKKTR